jgi:hypothetical protein
MALVREILLRVNADPSLNVSRFSAVRIFLATHKTKSPTTLTFSLRLVS